MSGMSVLLALAALSALFGAGRWVNAIKRMNAHGMTDSRTSDAFGQAAVATTVFLVSIACAMLLAIWIIDA